MALIAIFISLALLIYLAYRGMSVLILAPAMALLAVLLSGNIEDLLPVYTQVFMKAMGGYLIQYVPLFLLGSIFGKLMESSGYALTIANHIAQQLGAKHALLAVVLACAILTYGGVSLFVVAFMMYPIGKSLFERSNISIKLLPGAIALGAFTFTMTALPGTPSIQNSIPSPFFGTDSFAAPGLGLIASCIMLGFGILWLNHQKNMLGQCEGARLSDTEVQGKLVTNALTNTRSIAFKLAIAPILLMGFTNLALAKWIIPHWKPDFLEQNTYGISSLSSMAGIWSIIIALSVGIAFIYFVQLLITKESVKTHEAINQGSAGSMLPILNTASEVGYGSVIAGLAGFVVIREFMMNLSPGNPLISEAITVNVLSGITGSASGGMSIALQTLGADYLAKGTALGISPELLHRIAVMASGCMDTLPHNGAVITLLGICQLSHRDSYRYIAMVTIVFPLLALSFIIFLASRLGSF
jgi:H+/gluconate symporter-like permease